MILDHINIAAPMPLLETVRAFYCSVMGLHEGSRPGFSGRGFWLYQGDSPFVHLSESNDHSAADKGHLDHVAFRSRGLGEMKERLEAAGVAYRASYIPDINLGQLFFKDPAGTGLEVNFPGEKP